jgi:hypothetical protein
VRQIIGCPCDIFIPPGMSSGKKDNNGSHRQKASTELNNLHRFYLVSCLFLRRSWFRYVICRCIWFHFISFHSQCGAIKENVSLLIEGHC